MGVPPLEFLEGVGDPIKRIGSGDLEFDGAGIDQVGHFGKHFRCRRLGAAFGLGADFAGLLKRDDGVDSLGCHAEIHRELDVVGAEQVYECVDSVWRRLSQPFSQPVTIGDRGDAMCAHPVGVGVPCDAKHLRLAQNQQLHDEAAHSTRGRRNGDRITRLGRDRADSGVRRHSDHVQRTGYFPTQLGWLTDQLIHRDRGVGGMAGPAEAEPQDLVADGELGDPGSDRSHDAGEVAALAGRKGGGEHVMQRARSDGGLAGIDPGGANFDHHLARPGRRHLHVRHVQHVPATVTVEPYGTRHRSRHLALLTPRIRPYPTPA